MTLSAEKGFYDKQFARQRAEVVDVAGAERALRTRGDRYFCIGDTLPNPSALSAVEWGFGEVSRLIALQRMFRSYAALDISASLLQRGQRIEADIRECNLNADLPLPDEAFDVSIAMMVIEHLFDPFHSFREISRTTKRGGYVFVNLPLITSLKNRARLLMGVLPVTSAKDWWDHREWDGGHLHYFSVESVRRLATLNGLTLQRTYAVGRYPRLKQLAPTMLCGEISFVFRRAL